MARAEIMLVHGSLCGLLGDHPSLLIYFGGLFLRSTKMHNTMDKAKGFYDMDELPEPLRPIMQPRPSGVPESTLLALLKAQDDKFTMATGEADKRNEQRFIAQQVGVKTAMEASEKAVAAAMAASEKAVNKAEKAADKRFEDLKQAIDSVSGAQSKLAGAIILAGAAIPVILWIMERK
jgi:hypothetical protein